MRPHTEILAAAALLAALGAAVAVPLRVEADRRGAREAELRTVELTGLMAQGLWTDEPVPAAAAWRRDFRRARPVLRVGETVRLRLASADVVHAFAAPELGIGRTEVYPGEIVELLLTPRQAGTFEYYCTTVCGEAHFAMRGVVEVLPAGAVPPPPPPVTGDGYWLVGEPPPGPPRLARGAWLFRRQGCLTCHGEAGRGGVANPGSMNATVPALDELARRTFLFTAEDVDAFLAVLDGDQPLERVEEAPGVPLFPTVKAQHLATRRLVAEGRTSARLGPASPQPPLDMPAWGARLPNGEIDAILAHLLTLGDGAAAANAAGPATNLPKGDSR